MSRVLLLLDQKENRQLLAHELATSHEVIDAAADEDLEQSFDLGVVDGSTLDRLWENVQRRRQREQPVFLPMLFVTARPDIKLVTRHLWRNIDDIVVTPIEKVELHARVAVMLRARAMSIALRERTQEALDAARMRDELLATVSHDLRNPLGSLSIACAALQHQSAELSPVARRHVTLMEQAISQMSRLVQDLLDVARIEAGLVLERRPEAVTKLLRDACAMLQHVADGKAIDLRCEVAAGVPAVHVDRQRVIQVLGNLIGNGLKFTPADGCVLVSAERDADHVRIAVADTGPGIPEADLHRVFDRFWQAHQSSDGGAGLGLPIARSLVQAHGGDMWVESRPGAGATFSFTLPIVKAPPDGDGN